MAKRQPLKAGDIFNGNTALKFISQRKGGALWLWRCSCGNEFEALSANVKSGKTRSCGHIIKEMAKRTNQKAREASFSLFRQATATTGPTTKNRSTGIRNVYLLPDGRYRVIISRENHTYNHFFTRLEEAIRNKTIVLNSYHNGEKDWYLR